MSDLVGLSTEVKPKIADKPELVEGTKYFEMDTLKTYKYSATDDDWYLYSGGSSGGANPEIIGSDKHLGDLNSVAVGYNELQEIFNDTIVVEDNEAYYIPRFAISEGDRWSVTYDDVSYDLVAYVDSSHGIPVICVGESFENAKEGEFPDYPFCIAYADDTMFIAETDGEHDLRIVCDAPVKIPSAYLDTTPFSEVHISYYDGDGEFLADKTPAEMWEEYVSGKTIIAVFTPYRARYGFPLTLNAVEISPTGCRFEAVAYSGVNSSINHVQIYITPSSVNMTSKKLLQVDQGVAHAGEILVVGEDGNITTKAM